MPFTLIGYFPKERVRVPEALAASGAAEICSVSDCIASGPLDWVEVWSYNTWGCFNTIDGALAAVSEQVLSYRVLAYSLFGQRFSDGAPVDFEVKTPTIQPLPSASELLGYDLVSKSTSDFFECSPLSCNFMALEIAVNRHCLVDTLDHAVEVAERFSAEQPEPGDYYLVKVHEITPR